MNMEDYKISVAGRFNSLNEDELNALRSLRGTSAGKTLAKLLGEEMQGVVTLGQQSKPTVKRRGLATR
jgi:hypothetical protein